MNRRALREPRGSSLSQAPSIVRDVLRSPGHPLEGRTRAEMESHFARDLSGVRVYVNDPGESLPFLTRIQHSFGRHDVSHARAHVGAKAAASAAALRAGAFTIGSDVVFGRKPSLLLAAHEAAHVVQQRSGLRLRSGLGSPGDDHERHADAVARLVVEGRSSEPLLDLYASRRGAPSQPPAVQCKHEPPDELPRSAYSLGDITKQTFSLDEVVVTGSRNEPSERDWLTGWMKVPFDIAMIMSGVIAVAAAMATTLVLSPVLAAGLVIAGTFAIAAGTVKLIADASGRPDLSDKVPNSYLGTTAGKLIDKIAGNKEPVAEKFLDVAEGLVLPSGGGKPVFGKLTDEMIEQADFASDVAELAVTIDESAKTAAAKNRPKDVSREPPSMERDTITTVPPPTASDTIVAPVDTTESIQPPLTASETIETVPPSRKSPAAGKGPLRVHPNEKGLKRAGAYVKSIIRRAGRPR